MNTIEELKEEIDERWSVLATPITVFGNESLIEYMPEEHFKSIAKYFIDSAVEIGKAEILEDSLKKIDEHKEQLTAQAYINGKNFGYAQGLEDGYAQGKTDGAAERCDLDLSAQEKEYCNREVSNE